MGQLCYLCLILRRDFKEKFSGRVRHATGRLVQLTGSVIEISHDSHWNRFKSSPIVRLILRSNIIERPQTGQRTSMGAGSIIRTC
jgi:hypothetical protein